MANPSSDVSDEEKEKDEETVDLRILDPDTIDLDLNHGRIGKKKFGTTYSIGIPVFEMEHD